MTMTTDSREKNQASTTMFRREYTIKKDDLHLEKQIFSYINIHSRFDCLEKQLKIIE